MSSAVLDLYDLERLAGRGHKAAIFTLARRMNVDADTVKRVLWTADPRRFPPTFKQGARQ